ncbi:hypothetical protein YPPY99_1173, partial [Yersinia pestis PY-99]|jgi:hypothetical protein
MTIV